MRWRVPKQLWQERLALWGASCGGVLATAPSAEHERFMRPFYIAVGMVAGGAFGYLYRIALPVGVGYVVYKRLCK